LFIHTVDHAYAGILSGVFLQEDEKDPEVEVAQVMQRGEEVWEVAMESLEIGLLSAGGRRTKRDLNSDMLSLPDGGAAGSARRTKVTQICERETEAETPSSEAAHDRLEFKVLVRGWQPKERQEWIIRLLDGQEEVTGKKRRTRN